VTVGSLQVTCSKLGISLRKWSPPNGNGATQPLRVVQRSVEHIEQSDDHIRAEFKLLIKTQNRQAAFDLPLSPDLMKQLVLEASVRGQSVVDLIGKILSQVLQKGLVEELLRNGKSPKV
jgi:hypothetical protein